MPGPLQVRSLEYIVVVFTVYFARWIRYSPIEDWKSPISDYMRWFCLIWKGRKWYQSCFGNVLGQNSQMWVLEAFEYFYRGRTTLVLVHLSVILVVNRILKTMDRNNKDSFQPKYETTTRKPHWNLLVVVLFDSHWKKCHTLASWFKPNKRRSYAQSNNGGHTRLIYDGFWPFNLVNHTCDPALITRAFIIMQGNFSPTRQLLVMKTGDLKI